MAITLPPPVVARQVVGVRTRPPWTRQRTWFTVIIVGWLGVFIASWLGIHMGFFSLFTGIGNIVHFLAQNFPPQFVDFSDTANEALTTLCIAVLGTAFALVLSLPVGFAAARNTTVHPVVRWAARTVIVGCRSVPDLVFAIIFVEAMGVGVLPGILALGCHSVGMLGKIYAETIEQVDPRPPEAVKSSGATRWQEIMTGVVPQTLPTFSSMALYRLDINLRSSVILGYVGAGGIGFLLNEYMGELQFRAAMGIVIVMFVMVVLMEIVAAVMRRSLIGLESLPVKVGANSVLAGDLITTTGRMGPSNIISGGNVVRARLADNLVAKVFPAKPRSPELSFDRHKLRPPWNRQRVQRFSFVAGALAAVVGSFIVTKTTPWQVLGSLHRIWDTVVLYFPPDFTSQRSNLVSGTLQSFGTAVVATTCGFVVALPFGLLAARNVSKRWVARAARLFLVVVRAVPELVIAIVFIVAVGLGLVAGALALTVGTVGFVAKLMADGLEEVAPMPREAVLSAGATRAQEVATSVIAPTVPMLTGNAFYMLDINFRSVTILGLVGGGGIGYLLWQSVNILAYRTTGAIIIIMFVVVLLIEVLTNWVRKHLI